MIRPELSLVSIMLIIAGETALLAFLYFISRFYELKFGLKTYYNVFIASAAALALMLAIAVLDIYTYYAVTLANCVAVAAIVIFGLRLFRMMTGVAK